MDPRFQYTDLDISSRTIELTKDKNKKYKGNITVTNKSDKCVGVKVKSNATKIYVVKPKKFILKPSEKQTFKVLEKANASLVFNITYNRIQKTRLTIGYVLRVYIVRMVIP